MTVRNISTSSYNASQALIANFENEIMQRCIYRKETLHTSNSTGLFLSPAMINKFIDEAKALIPNSFLALSDRYSKTLILPMVAIVELQSDTDTRILSIKENKPVATDGSDDENGIDGALYITSLDKEIIDKVDKLFEKYTINAGGNNNIINMIVSTPMGFSVSPFGSIGMPLLRDNYSDNVLEGFDHIVKDLQSSNPTGRLSIIEGPPGTGKSYMIRGLIEAAKDCTWIFIPSKNVEDLDGPGLVNVLKSTKIKSKDKPVVLIVEDADHCLVRREQTSLSTISTFLNLSDGLVGALLDLRLIATTNSKSIDFEPALMRPGRLCEHMVVDKLTPKKANEILARLRKVDDTNEFKEEVTLSQVYAKHNNSVVDYPTDETNNNKIGFL